MSFGNFKAILNNICRKIHNQTKSKDDIACITLNIEKKSGTFIKITTKRTISVLFPNNLWSLLGLIDRNTNQSHSYSPVHFQIF